MSFSIPADINSWDRLRTAEFYHRDLGWAIHALCPPNRGQDHERGKKPIAKGWRAHTAAEVTPDYLREHFANGSNFNLGVVVRGPFVHVDLDSKPDGGESVRTWLASQPELAAIPRERTGGGAHLVFVCRDLPEAVAKAKKAITAQITDEVTAEFYTDGMNLVLSPSVHKSGARYSWDVTGEIPEVSWAQIRQWFGFTEPEGAKRGRPPKEKPWWARFKGALHSLDAVALFKEADLLGDCIDPDVGKWSVHCPWESEHSGAKGGNGCDTDTVIFQGESADNPPGFKCLHAHCADRSLKEVLETLDDVKPGIVDHHCREMRVWSDGQAAPDGRHRVLLPEMDRPDSEFAAEMGEHIAPRKQWFNKADTVVCVTLRRFSEKIAALTFHPVQPVEACTAAEQFVQTGVLREDKATGDMIFLRHTMTRETAAKLIAAPQFRRQLPEIIRILDIPLPILHASSIVFPEPGYDPRFRSYLDPEAPRITPMPFDRAIELLKEVHADFGWKDDQSLVHALSRMITPFCRGLMGWDARFPLWHYSGNRPRAGKDYLAGVTQILYEGRTCEDAPLERESEETRKRIDVLAEGEPDVRGKAEFDLVGQRQVGLGLGAAEIARPEGLGCDRADEGGVLDVALAVGEVHRAASGGGCRGDPDVIWEVIRRLIGELLVQRNAKLALECFALVSGVSFVGDSMSDIARRHRVTRAAVSKRCIELGEKLALPPARAMRALTARKAYARARNHHLWEHD